MELTSDELLSAKEAGEEWAWITSKDYPPNKHKWSCAMQYMGPIPKHLHPNITDDASACNEKGLKRTLWRLHVEKAATMWWARESRSWMSVSARSARRKSNTKSA
jgi:hypothetical protein